MALTPARREHAGPFAQARDDAAAKLREVKGGDDPSLDRRRRLQAATFAEVAARFLEEHGGTLKPLTLVNYRALLANHILPAFGLERMGGSAWSTPRPGARIP